MDEAKTLMTFRLSMLHPDVASGEWPARLRNDTSFHQDLIDMAVELLKQAKYPVIALRTMLVVNAKCDLICQQIAAEKGYPYWGGARGR
jgi:hypothetical protein